MEEKINVFFVSLSFKDQNAVRNSKHPPAAEQGWRSSPDGMKIPPGSTPTQWSEGPLFLLILCRWQRDTRGSGPSCHVTRLAHAKPPRVAADLLPEAAGCCLTDVVATYMQTKVRRHDWPTMTERWGGGWEAVKVLRGQKGWLHEGQSETKTSELEKIKRKLSRFFAV